MEYQDWIKEKPLNQLVCGDCMEGMREFPDGYFDLAIVDPPYGIGANREKEHNGWNDYGIKEWDLSRPNAEYFNELYRTSKNQVIWGADYYPEYLIGSMGWIFWDKGQRNFSCSDGELAFTSYGRALRVYSYSRAKLNKDRIHPTQKPVQLYKWILHNYAKPDFKIIDTHVGSASSIIAFLDFGCEYLGFEIDHDYYKAAQERIRIHKMQTKLF